MIIEILFIITTTLLIAASIKLAGAILGNGVSMPQILPYVKISPTHYLVMYPSIYFQVWFWTDRLNMFS